MILMRLTKRAIFAGVILLASGCSDGSSLFDESVSDADMNVSQKILKSVAEESKEALQSVLRTTRLELLNEHRKEILQFNGADSAKVSLRAKLKDARKLIHIRHAQLLVDYEVKSAKRIGEILLSSL